MRLTTLLILFPFFLFAQFKFDGQLSKLRFGKTSVKRALRIIPGVYEVDTVKTAHINFGTYCKTIRKISFKDSIQGISIHFDFETRKLNSVFLFGNCSKEILKGKGIKIGKSTYNDIVDVLGEPKEYSKRSEYVFKNNCKVWFRYKEGVLASVRISYY